MQYCVDVPFRTGRHLHVHGVVTDRGSIPGEFGTGADDSKQVFLLEGRACWRQLRRSCAASLQTNRDSVWTDASAIETYLKGRGESSSRAICETCRTNTLMLSPACGSCRTELHSLTSINQRDSAAFAARSEASWWHHDGAMLPCCAPDG